MVCPSISASTCPTTPACRMWMTRAPPGRPLGTPSTMAPSTSWATPLSWTSPLAHPNTCKPSPLLCCCAVLCCAVLCCAVLCCAVLCCLNNTEQACQACFGSNVDEQLLLMLDDQGTVCDVWQLCQYSQRPVCSHPEGLLAVLAGSSQPIWQL